MALFKAAERKAAEAIADLGYSNPFTAARVEAERRVLGDAFVPAGTLMHTDPDQVHESPNVIGITALIETMATRMRKRLADGATFEPGEGSWYEAMVLYLLYYRYQQSLRKALDNGLTGSAPAEGTGVKFAFYADYVKDLHFFLEVGCFKSELLDEPAHLFACFFQLRRAFQHIFGQIVGRCEPILQLRAAVWESVFTHDLRRYQRLLYNRMADYTTLITGPSGTGKELVARAIGLSRYIPFNPRTATFAGEFAGDFYAVNLSALSPTLIESELFGHRRGAFTGAQSDRRGWFEVCPPMGTVFLDEIGDLDPAIQVKLLRLLQLRTFQRVGETRSRRFEGKVIAATNQDIEQRMQQGGFRRDFYYRLCSDIIRTPPLAEQIAGDREQLHALVTHICGRLVGEEAEVLATDVENWIDQHLGENYPWPGNVRELEQCVRNVLIRREYRPTSPGARAAGPAEALAADVACASLDAQQLMRRYCTLVYARYGSYEAAAEHLGVDRRTVKARIDEQMLAELKAGR